MKKQVEEVSEKKEVLNVNELAKKNYEALTTLSFNQIDAFQKYIWSKYTDIKFNEFTKSIELFTPTGKEIFDDRKINEWLYDLWTDVDYLTVDKRSTYKFPEEGTIIDYTEELRKFTTSFKKTKCTIEANKVLTIINNNKISKPYDPIQEILDRIEPLATGCTGTPELEKYISCFTFNNAAPVVDMYFKSWVAGVFRNYYVYKDYYDAILIFKSKQGDGKTKAIEKKLLNIFSDYVIKNFTWDDSDKDQIKSLATSLVIYDDELSATTKAKVELVKKITGMRKMNGVRPPYGRLDQQYIRRASFIGATNSNTITNDITGTRRYLILDLVKIDLEKLDTVNYELLWSESYNYFHLQNNEVWLEFSTVEKENRGFKERLVEEDYLEKYFDFTKEPNQYYSNTEIIQYLKKLDCDIKADQQTMNKISKIFAARGVVKYTNKRVNGKFYGSIYHIHDIMESELFATKQLLGVKQKTIK